MRLCLIPARGGSKRLPRKNILPVSGKPMLAWPVEVARQSGLFDRIVVSTEDAEIAAVARDCGAELISRPDDIAQDRSTVGQVCLHALETLPETTEFCCLYATAFLLRPETLARAHVLLDSPPAADYVMGVSEYDYPPVQALKADSNGFLAYQWPEWRGVQSQFQPHLVVSNGTFCWARAEAFRHEKTFYGAKLCGCIVPRDEAVDIDTADDLTQAVAKLEGRACG